MDNKVKIETNEGKIVPRPLAFPTTKMNFGELAEKLEKYEIKINKQVNKSEFKGELSICNYLDEQIEEGVLFGGDRAKELFRDANITFTADDDNDDNALHPVKAQFIKNYYFERGQIKTHYILLVKYKEMCTKYIIDGNNQGESVKGFCEKHSYIEKKRLLNKRIDIRSTCTGCNSNILVNTNELNKQITGNINVKIIYGRHMSEGCLFKWPSDIRSMCNLNQKIDTSIDIEAYNERIDQICKDTVADYKDTRKRKAKSTLQPTHGNDAAHAYVDETQCTICKKKYVDKKTAVLHVKVKHLKTSHTCEFCGQSFQTSLARRMHMEKKHSERLPHKCTKCYTMFTTENEKDNHEKDCTTKRYECYLCNFKLGYLRRLKEHIKQVHSKKTKQLQPMHGNDAHAYVDETQCTICKKKYVNKSAALRHVKVKHLQTSHTCEFCGQSFQTSLDRRMHKEKKHSERLPHKCTKCYTMFTTENEKENHEKDCTTKRYECYLCNFKAPALWNLKRHIKKVHLKETIEMRIAKPKPLKCAICDCDTVFKSEADLTHHLNEHQANASRRLINGAPQANESSSQSKRAKLREEQLPNPSSPAWNPTVVLHRIGGPLQTGTKPTITSTSKKMKRRMSTKLQKSIPTNNDTSNTDRVRPQREAKKKKINYKYPSDDEDDNYKKVYSTDEESDYDENDD